MLKDCSHHTKNPCRLHNLEVIVSIKDMARETPQIYALLDYHQEDHQSTIVEVGGNISKKSISILIDRGSTHSYVSPKVDEIFSLVKVNHNKSW